MNTNRPRRRTHGPRPSARTPAYHRLSHPFAPQPVFSEDRVAALHEAALGVLETLGLRVLLPEAIGTYRVGGALVAGDTVRIGREIVAEALSRAPRRIPCTAGARAPDLVLEPGALVFLAGCGAPNVSDARRGKMPNRKKRYSPLAKMATCIPDTTKRWTVPVRKNASLCTSSNSVRAPSNRADASPACSGRSRRQRRLPPCCLETPIIRIGL